MTNVEQNLNNICRECVTKHVKSHEDLHASHVYVTDDNITLLATYLLLHNSSSDRQLAYTWSSFIFYKNIYC